MGRKHGDSTPPTHELLGLDSRFPPPPLFPPPPPALRNDANALLREAIFNNILEKIKRGIKVSSSRVLEYIAALWFCWLYAFVSYVLVLINSVLTHLILFLTG